MIILRAAVLIAMSALLGHGHVVQAIRDYDGSDASALPKRLSASGLYDAASAKGRKTTEGIRAYEVNTPLWSDGAAKQRFVDLPVGSKIVPTDSDRYVIPDKTVFIKNFQIDTVYGDSASRILIETRFLVVSKDPARADKRYSGFTYKWRRDQLDADLLDPGEGLDTAHLVLLNGKRVGKRWSYPSGSDCNQCHRGRGTLGFITPQLNRPDAANPAVNQLQALFAAGILSADVSKTSFPRWVGLKETGPAATPEAKVRSYFAANCSHCHGNQVSLEGAGHDFDYFSPARKTDFSKSAGGYVGKPTGKEPGYPQIVYPGYPESSYVMFRMKSRGDLSFHGLAQMPPLATYQLDSGAVKIVRDWICSLGSRPRTCSEPEIQGDGEYWEPVTAIRAASEGSKAASWVTQEVPWIRNGILHTPSARSAESTQARRNGSGRTGRVRLYARDGREIPLESLGADIWRLPQGMGPGLYLLDGYGSRDRSGSGDRGEGEGRGWSGGRGSTVLSYLP